MNRIDINIKNAPLVMGILNVTPDSFYDGGKYNSIDSALYHVRDMINDGVDIVDIGGESTRPGAEEVTLEEEIDRVCPVIEKLYMNLIYRFLSTPENLRLLMKH